MSKAKPIETLLKLKQIKPDLEFRGADKRVYEEFVERQAEASLMATIQEDKPKKKTKKVKQTIPMEMVETGESEPMAMSAEPVAESEPANESDDTQIEESVPGEEIDF